MERIIETKLDTDLYKLTMGQAVWHNFPGVGAGFSFINRGKTQFPGGFADKIQDQVEQMAYLKSTPEERAFLEKRCPYLTSGYLDWFESYRFDPREVSVKQEEGALSVDIYGPWHRTIFWEVPLLAIISELYFKETGQVSQKGWEERCRQKARLLAEAEARYADFGTRRRFSHAVHERVVEILKQYGGRSFLGTSNVELAMRYDLLPIGTFAHEWVMGMAGILGVEYANQMAMEYWFKEFGGKLATALTDTFTTDVFLRAYTREKARMFPTLRQDSGSPERWTDLVVDHIKSLGLNPLDFTALYSDSLNPQRVLEIMDYSRGRIKTLFGIGTNFTNDVGPKPLNMVIKMFYLTRPDIFGTIPVVKLSDDLGKISGDKRVVRGIMDRLELAQVA